MAEVTPSPAASREARPGLSHGIDLRGKRRGGAPRGERASPSPPSPACRGGRRGAQGALPHPMMRPLVGAPVGAPPPLICGGEELVDFFAKLGRTCVARTDLIIRPREVKRSGGRGLCEAWWRGRTA